MASAILTRIKTELEARLNASSDVTIDEALLGGAAVTNLFAAVMGTASFAIEQTILTATDDLIALRGMAAVLDSTTIPVEVQFRDEGGLIVNVEGRVPAVTPLATAAAGRFLVGAFAVPQGLAKLRIKTVSATVTTSTNTSLVVFSDTGDTEVADFITVRQPKLSISATGLDQAAPAVVAQLEGLLVIANVSFVVKGQLGGVGAFSVAPANNDLLLTTEQFITGFLESAVPQFPNLPVTDLQLFADLGSSDVTITATISGSWRIPLGVNPPELTAITVTVQKKGNSITGRIVGRMTVAGQNLSVQTSIPGELTLAGDLPTLNLTDLVRDVSGPVLSIPAGIPTIQLDASHFVIRFDGSLPLLALQTTVAGFGKAVVVIAQVSDSWQALAAFIPAADWKFANLAPVLAPLDVLKIEAPKLLIASFDRDDFPIPAIDGIAISGRIRKGVALDASLSLQGKGLDFVASLIGVRELPLRLSTLNDLASAEIAATLSGTKTLVPSVLTLENVAIALTPAPFAVMLRSEALVVIDGDALPRFRIAVGVSEATQKITLETIEPWVKPFGISGLTILRVILDIQTAPTPAYGVLGDLEIAGNIIRVACQFVGSAPSALVGELQGRLSLGEVLRDLVGLGLPSVLDLSIEDFSVQIVSNPLGATIGSVHFEPGLSLRGTLGMLGLELLVNIRIRPESGVFASGALKKKVEFGNVLVISNAAGDGPPSMQLDTTSSPVLKLNGRLVLLGLAETIEASVERNGFTVKLRRELGIGRYDLDTKFESVQSFRAAGSFEFGLSATISTDLGKIVLDTGCSGSMTVTMADGSFELIADGGFTFAGNTLTLPTLKLTAAIDSLEELPPRVRDLVVAKAQDVFKSVLEDPGKWVQAIAANGIREVENVAKILKDRFGKDADFIGRQLKTVLNQSSLEVGQALKRIGEAPERIASVLCDLGDQAPNVRDTLNRIGIPADQISRIMRDTFPGIPHLDEVIHTDTHADSPVIPPVSQHTDSPVIPHVDQHTDSPVIPPVRQHTDSPVIPPVRQHTDSPFVPGVSLHTDDRGPGISNHVDRRVAGIHFDTHQDVPGPHFDAHADTPAVGHLDAHNDTPGRGHLDTHNDEPGRGHLDAHNDEATRGHLDAHNDEPGRGHVDAHGDVAVHADAP